MHEGEPVNDNIDPDEIARFNALASRWWDPGGEMRPLHRMNPVRVRYINTHAEIAGRRCLDVGCGGGLLTEALAAHGADVTGIDLAPASLAVARLHLAEKGLDVRYLETDAEQLAAKEGSCYDIVTCLEVLEHVPQPERLVAACARLARPGGSVFFSTLNRHPRAFIEAIVGAEYVLGLLPKGTHEFARFIEPAQLDCWGRRTGLALQDLTGLHYSVASGEFSLRPGIDVNYLAHFRRTAAA